MNDFNPTEQNIFDIRRSIVRLQEEKTPFVNKKKEIDTKLSVYKNQIRTAGRKLAPYEYKDICRKQDELKNIKKDLEESINKINEEIRKRVLLEDEVRLHLKTNNLLDSPSESAIRTELIRMKTYYMGFASDNTRVSSTRIMASRFAEELQSLINII